MAPMHDDRPMKPYRLRLDFVTTAPNVEATQPQLDRLIAAANSAGLMYEGGIVTLVPDDAIIKDSPLYRALHHPTRMARLHAAARRLSPFKRPEISAGYPLSPEEQDAVDRAIKRFGIDTKSDGCKPKA